MPPKLFVVSLMYFPHKYIYICLCRAVRKVEQERHVTGWTGKLKASIHYRFLPLSVTAAWNPVQNISIWAYLDLEAPDQTFSSSCVRIQGDLQEFELSDCNLCLLAPHSQCTDFPDVVIQQHVRSTALRFIRSWRFWCHSPPPFSPPLRESVGLFIGVIKPQENHSFHSSWNIFTQTCLLLSSCLPGWKPCGLAFYSPTLRLTLHSVWVHLYRSI